MISSILPFILGVIFVSALFPHRKRMRKRLQRFLLVIKTNLIASTLIALSFMAGLICTALIYHWDNISKNFFNVRFIELIQVGAALIIALFITYFIQSKLSHSIKKREIISELFSLFEKNAAELHELAIAYIQEPDDKSKHRITSNFKKLGILLSIIKEAKKPSEDILINSTSLLKAYFKFKEAITDKPFSKIEESIQIDLLDRVSATYKDLLLKLYKCRLDIYSS